MRQYNKSKKHTTVNNRLFTLQVFEYEQITYNLLHKRRFTIIHYRHTHV